MSGNTRKTESNFARPATSKDVAKLAGVSRATVSAVLNRREGTIRTSEKTRIRVLDAAKQLGYSPNPVARALRRKKSGTIAYIPRHRHTDPGYYHLTYQLSLSVGRCAARHHYHSVEVSPEAAIDDDVDDMIDILLNRRPDGVIFDAPRSVEDVRRVVDRGISVVQLLRPLAEVETSTVTVNPSAGISTAMECLASLGHRSVGYIGNGDRHDVELRRLDAFQSALSSLGIEIQSDGIILGHRYSIDEGARLMDKLLAVEHRPTAVFVASDVLAMGALRALYAADIRVPDRMSLVSFDDTHAAMLYPPISAVAQPLEEIVEAAVGLLMNALETQGDPLEPIQHLELTTEFRSRQSTAAPVDTSR